MASNLNNKDSIQLTDWQLFTNNGSFNNPLPPCRRLRKRNPYFILEIDPNYIRHRCSTARSRNQSAISTSTRRVLSARHISYRRPPRVKPIEINLDEENDYFNTQMVYSTNRLVGGRLSTTSSHHSNLSAPQAWSISCLHRAIIAIDEQAKKDYEVGRAMNALAAWQNALVFCDELSQRNQLWPENKAALDEEIEELKRIYKHHVEETMRKNKQANIFMIPTRKCHNCKIEQSVDQYHERLSHLCQHVERTICNKCIQHQIKTQSQSSKKTEFNCPEPNCKIKLNLKQIRQLLNSNTNPLVSSNQQKNKTEFIYCSHDQCGSGQFYIFNENLPPIFNCILCKKQTCAVHRIKWHKGMTCTEYDQQQLLLKTVKQCPQCHNDIKRNLNDNSIQCVRCNLEFCWECLADYRKIQRKGSQFHKTTCSNYENKSEKQTSKSSACTLL